MSEPEELRTVSECSNCRKYLFFLQPDGGWLCQGCRYHLTPWKNLSSPPWCKGCIDNGGYMRCPKHGVPEAFGSTNLPYEG